MNGPIWIYRCTVEGAVGALNTATADVTLERCVFTTTDLPGGAGTTHVESITVADTDLDEDLALSGSARDSYLGTHGAEVA